MPQTDYDRREQQRARWQESLLKMTPTQLADSIERERALKKEHDDQARRTSAIIAGRITALEHALVERLGEGEAVQAPSTGRFAFRSQVAAGNASVREDALDALADRLPVELRPAQVTKYPGVTAIRERRKDLAEAGIKLRDVLLLPGLVPGIKWRTMREPVAGDGGE